MTAPFAILVVAGFGFALQLSQVAPAIGEPLFQAAIALMAFNLSQRLSKLEVLFREVRKNVPEQCPLHKQEKK